MQARRDDFAAANLAIQNILHSLIDRAEGSMFKAVEEAKVEVHAGAATVDRLAVRFSNVLNGTYPIVRNAGNLLRLLDQIDEWVRQSTEAAPDRFGAIEQSLQRASARASGFRSRPMTGAIPTG